MNSSKTRSNAANMYDIKAIEFGQQQTATTKTTTNSPILNTTTATNNSSCNSCSIVAHTAVATTATAIKTTPPTTTSTTTTAAAYAPQLLNAYSTCSIISHGKLGATDYSNNNNNNNSNKHNDKNHSSKNNRSLTSPRSPADSTHMTLLSLRRRRLFQRHACLLSILAAFIFGLALGVFMPMFGLPSVFTPLASATAADGKTASSLQMLPLADVQAAPLTSTLNQTHTMEHPRSDFPTIYESVHASSNSLLDSSTAAAIGERSFSVAFIKENDVELSAEQIFRNAFHLQQDGASPDALLVKRLDDSDGSIREFRVQRIAEGRYRKGPERRLSKPSLEEQLLPAHDRSAVNHISFVPLAQRIAQQAAHPQRQRGIIKDDIYWGELVERALPAGFGAEDTKDWNNYLRTQGVVERLEAGCGRMQNRLVVFADGTRACARYRQNTDQIQGELFSFYLGQLLRLSNLAPSAASVIDLDARTWSGAIVDITQAQWKQQRPVVLTRWLPDLEPAGIPQPFQPLERHLNKYDVWNITLGAAAEALRDTTNDEPPSSPPQQGLLKRLGAANGAPHNHQSTMAKQSATAAAASLAANALAALNTSSGAPLLQRLIELAQWSDLIVFDYLIANLDRVVNNLYNFQWNADIMAAPAHNLARQINSQLLVFLDNESGLLHGYRLLKKYEAYHGLLLDNLCVFRQPTIEALRQLRAYGAGRKLRELFEQTTSAELRDVLPTLPDKSIKILVDRIDRVLGQVQKCRELLADR